MEADKLRVMAAARDDATYRAEEALRRQAERHAAALRAAEEGWAARLAATQAKLEEARAAGSERERFFGEYVQQAEDDFEDHSERINDKLTVQQEAAEAREQQLKASNNILKRTNLRLKGAARRLCTVQLTRGLQAAKHACGVWPCEMCSSAVPPACVLGLHPPHQTTAQPTRPSTSSAWTSSRPTTRRSRRPARSCD